MLRRAATQIRAILQVMRLPLVITAISNAQAGLVLSNRFDVDEPWPSSASLALLAMSFGLYTFGMVSNDIIDYRRDRYLSADKALPSGRLHLVTAHVLAATLLIIGVAGGLSWSIGFGGGLSAAFFLAWTIVLIFFYNLAGKFVGAIGIITLGLIRFFHAATAQPNLGVLWHPLLLMDHVIVLSAVCYILEGKRPRLSIAHRWLIGLGLLGLNMLFVASVLLLAWLRRKTAEEVGLQEGLLWPLAMAGVFALIATSVILSLRESDGLSVRELLDRRRRVGRKLMLFGLLWLVIYDAAFVFGFLR